MLDRVSSSASERIAAHVQTLLKKHAIDRDVGPNDDLTESGLSSLDTVNLMLAIEAEFGVSIPDRDMTPANFRSIARIEKLVAGLLENA